MLKTKNNLLFASVLAVMFVFAFPTIAKSGQNQNANQAQQRQMNVQEHKNAVADFVQNILQVADREGGIGQQIRIIAQEQNQSAGISIQAMEQVQARSRIKTFLLGTDYKNLGVLRSEVVQTRNRLEQLNRLMENVQNQAGQTELQGQIQDLEQEQEKIENFIEGQEGKFSLFGWLLKMFSQ